MGQRVERGRPRKPAMSRADGAGGDESAASKSVSGAMRNEPRRRALSGRRRDRVAMSGPKTGSRTMPAISSVPASIGCTSTAPPMRAAARTAAAPRRSSATPPVSVLWAPGTADLTTTAPPSAVAAAPRRGARAPPDERDAVGLEQAPALVGIEPRVVGPSARRPRRRARPRGRRRRARARRPRAVAARRRGGPPRRARVRPPRARRTSQTRDGAAARERLRAEQDGDDRLLVRRRRPTAASMASSTSAVRRHAGRTKSTQTASKAGSSSSGGSTAANVAPVAEPSRSIGLREAGLGRRHGAQPLARRGRGLRQLQALGLAGVGDRMPRPPAFVSTATRGPGGSGCDESRAAASSNSESVRMRSTPAWRKSASTAASELAIAAVWEAAARAPAA